VDGVQLVVAVHDRTEMWRRRLGRYLPGVVVKAGRLVLRMTIGPTVARRQRRWLAR